MEYKAIYKTSPNNEIKHWKYIKKVKKNGKWRYYYDDSELKKYEQGITEESAKSTKNQTGGTDEVSKKTTYKQSDKLLDSIREFTNSGTISSGSTRSSYKSQDVIKEQGKISRSYAKAEKWVYDNFLKSGGSSKRKKNIKSAINKGKRAVGKFFRRFTN